MPYNPDKHHRKSIRLENYDYRQAGVYFITICAHQYQYLFGYIQNTTLNLTAYGNIAQDCWIDIPNHFPHVELDLFVVMPNHIHGILVIVDDGENDARRGLPWQAPTPSQSQLNIQPSTSPIPTTPPITQPTKREFSKPISGSLGTIIGAYKSSVTRIIRQHHPDDTSPIWQRNYYETIVRDENSLVTIRNYIENNPLVWEQDKFYQRQIDI